MSEAPRLFLAASFPSGERAKPFAPYHPHAILDAVVSITRVVLRRGGTLTFGAHPSISPLVLSIAAEVDRPGAIEIVQSEHYREVVPRETLELEHAGWGRIEWIGNDPGEPPQNALRRMRAAIMDRELAAGAFVGGMEGIIEELELFRVHHGGRPAFVLRAPGGAARRAEGGGDMVRLVDDERYPAVALEIADAMGLPGSDAARVSPAG